MQSKKLYSVLGGKYVLDVPAGEARFWAALAERWKCPYKVYSDRIMANYFPQCTLKPDDIP